MRLQEFRGNSLSTVAFFVASSVAVLALLALFLPRVETLITSNISLALLLFLGTSTLAALSAMKFFRVDREILRVANDIKNLMKVKRKETPAELIEGGNAMETRNQHLMGK